MPPSNKGHIVTQTVAKNLPATDFKSLNKSAESLFCFGHMQAVHVYSTDDYLFVKANCLPEMRKDELYHVWRMALSENGYELVHAECCCPVGTGPHG